MCQSEFHNDIPAWRWLQKNNLSQCRLFAVEILNKISDATLSQGRATDRITIWQIISLHIKGVFRSHPKILRPLLPIWQRQCAVRRISLQLRARSSQQILDPEKLRRGARNTFKEYTTYCRYKGKFHKQLHQHRMIGFVSLFLE